MKKSIVVTVFVLVLSLVMSSCGSAPQNGGNASASGHKSLLDGAKPWVLDGGSADSKRICATTGVDTSEESFTDDVDYATKRSRTELANQMGVVVNAVFKDNREKTKKNGVRSDEEAIVDTSIQDIFDTTVAGASRVDAWDNGKQLWVLVCIDTEKFYDVIRNSEKLSDNIKNEVMEKAVQNWKELRQRGK